MCLSSTSFVILVNGFAKVLVKAFKGLRHGDPLAPFFFSIAVDVLSRMVARIEDHGLLEGFFVGKDRARMSSFSL